jgi:hypothetical protein
MSNGSLLQTTEAWIVQNNPSFNFEGQRGLDVLEKFCEHLGYKDTGPTNTRALDKFLLDNPGAIEAIIKWVEDTRSPEFYAKLEKVVKAQARRNEIKRDRFFKSSKDPK